MQTVGTVRPQRYSSTQCDNGGPWEFANTLIPDYNVPFTDWWLDRMHHIFAKGAKVVAFFFTANSATMQTVGQWLVQSSKAAALVLGFSLLFRL
jgi:hypothetical protein